MPFNDRERQYCSDCASRCLCCTVRLRDWARRLRWKGFKSRSRPGYQLVRFGITTTILYESFKDNTTTRGRLEFESRRPVQWSRGSCFCRSYSAGMASLTSACVCRDLSSHATQISVQPLLDVQFGSCTTAPGCSACTRGHFFDLYSSI